MNKEQFQTIAGALAIIAGALFVLWLLGRTARRARRHFEDLMERAGETRDPEAELAVAQRRLTALRLVVNGAKYFVSASAVLLVLSQAGIQLGTLLFPVGFFGAALGLGGQNLVRDLVAGLFIVFEGQFAVGDVVSINGTLGTVEEVGLRVTRLRDDSGQIFFFPNGAITTISKYPRRALPVLLWIPLAETDSRAIAETVVPRVLADFDAHLDAVLDDLELLPVSQNTYAPPIEAIDDEQTPNEQAQGKGETPIETAAIETPAPAEVATTALAKPPALWLCWKFSVRPARAVVLREKLPSRLSAALEHAGAKTAGAAIEIANAPAV